MLSTYSRHSFAATHLKSFSVVFSFKASAIAQPETSVREFQVRLKNVRKRGELDKYMQSKTFRSKFGGCAECQGKWKRKL